MPIREKASAILGTPIRTGRWVAYTDALDREGKFTRKTMMELIMTLCEEVEELEKRLESTGSSEEMGPLVIYKPEEKDGTSEA